MPTPGINRSLPQGPLGPSPKSRPATPSTQVATPQGARTRGSNEASNALSARTSSRGSSRSASSVRPDAGQGAIASSVYDMVRSGVVRMQSEVSDAALRRATQAAERGIASLLKSFPQLAA